MVTNLLLALLAVYLLAEVTTYIVGAKRYGVAWPIHALKGAWSRFRSPKVSHTQEWEEEEGEDEECECGQCNSVTF